MGAEDGGGDTRREQETLDDLLLAYVNEGGGTVNEQKQGNRRVNLNGYIYIFVHRVLICLGCYNKYHRLSGLLTIEIYFS